MHFPRCDDGLLGRTLALVAALELIYGMTAEEGLDGGGLCYLNNLSVALFLINIMGKPRSRANPL